jgi:arylsulfatase
MTRVPRHASIPAVLLACAAVAALLGAGEPSAKRPSILLVVVDTLRWDAGDAAGGAGAAIPSWLKTRGTHFDNALAASDWTSPSVLGLLTSRYPSDCGLLSTNPISTQPDDWMLPFRLRQAGYATAAVLSNPTLTGKRLHLEGGFDLVDAKMTAMEPNRNVAVRRAPQTTDAALAALASLRTRGKPWFLWVQYLEPHGPYLPPPPYPQAAEDPGESLPIARSDIAEKGALPRYQFLKECRGRNDYAARYKGSAAAALDEVDRFLSAAERKGLLDDTIVVFTSDHGEYLGEQDFWFQHGIHLNPAVVHVPLVVSRGKADAKRNEPRAVSHLDVYPTLLRLLGVPVPPAARGEDLFSPPARRRFPILTENVAFPDSAEVGALLGGKLWIKSTGFAPEVFRVDGDEWAPEIAGAGASAGVAEVDAEMRRIRNLPLPERTLPPEEIRKLRALGYLR